jgi:hypothetical protein
LLGKARHTYEMVQIDEEELDDSRIIGLDELKSNMLPPIAIPGSKAQGSLVKNIITNLGNSYGVEKGSGH